MDEIKFSVEELQQPGRRGYIRAVYASRRLGLPIPMCSRSFFLRQIGCAPEDVPDDVVDEVVFASGVDCYLAPDDCGCKGLWPINGFYDLRDVYCKHEIQARRSGTWPQAESSNQAKFDSLYHARVKARLEGLDPGPFHEYIRPAHYFGTAATTPQLNDDETPF